MKLIVIFSFVLIIYYVKAMPYNNNKDKKPQIRNDDDMAVEINDKNGVNKNKRSTNNQEGGNNDDQGDNNDNQGENNDNQGENNDNQGENGNNKDRKKGNQQMDVMIKRNKRELGDKDVTHGENAKDKMQNATNTVGKEANKVLEKAGDKVENKDDKKGENKSGAKDANKDGTKTDDKKVDTKKEDAKQDGNKKEDDKKGDKKKEDDKNGSAGTPGNTFKGGKSNIQSDQKGNEKNGNGMKSRERRYTVGDPTF